MRIGVTGAAGYIGGHLTRALSAAGHEVRGQDTRPVRPGRSFDLSDDKARFHWLSGVKPELVVHLAARYGRVWCEDGLKETAYQNAGLTAELARDCAGLGIRLMYVSSSEVYGAAAMQGPVDEASPLRPLNMYGMSKRWGEEAARLYAPEGLAVARLNMPYGPPAVLPLPGEVPLHSGRVGPAGYNALHTMLWQASHEMPIVVHRGTDRCYTWVADAIRGLVMIIESGKDGTWNVCRDDDYVSSAELARRCVKLAGSASEVTEEEPGGQVTPRKHLSSARLRSLGWRPSVSLEDGMRETLAYVSMFDRESRWRGALFPEGVC